MEAELPALPSWVLRRLRLHWDELFLKTVCKHRSATRSRVLVAAARRGDLWAVEFCWDKGPRTRAYQALKTAATNSHWEVMDFFIREMKTGLLDLDDAALKMYERVTAEENMMLLRLFYDELVSFIEAWRVEFFGMLDSKFDSFIKYKILPSLGMTVRAYKIMKKRAASYAHEYLMVLYIYLFLPFLRHSLGGPRPRECTLFRMHDRKELKRLHILRPWARLADYIF